MAMSMSLYATIAKIKQVKLGSTMAKRESQSTVVRKLFGLLDTNKGQIKVFHCACLDRHPIR
jgi:hypothetical protein